MAKKITFKKEFVSLVSNQSVIISILNRSNVAVTNTFMSIKQSEHYTAERIHITLAVDDLKECDGIGLNLSVFGKLSGLKYINTLITKNSHVSRITFI